jgi:hypothetical protein
MSAGGASGCARAPPTGAGRAAGLARCGRSSNGPASGLAQPRGLGGAAHREVRAGQFCRWLLVALEGRAARVRRADQGGLNGQQRPRGRAGLAGRLGQAPPPEEGIQCEE